MRCPARDLRSKGECVDSSKAHLITLWCAVLSKSDKGISLLLPKDVSFVHFRVLSELTLANMKGASVMRLARALVLKPDDVVAAVEVLAMKGLVREGARCVSSGRCDDGGPIKTAAPSGSSAPDTGVYLTVEGRNLAHELLGTVSQYLEGCRVKLSSEDIQLLASMLSNALSVPGSLYTGKDSVSGSDVLDVPPLRITAFAMMRQAISVAIKSNLSLSFTDFRFLLELYPKKRGVDKLLRARDMVRFLGTGRSYVTTASLRLEEEGLIERIPDADDARGILFRLTPRGNAAVQEVGDDIFAVFASLSGEHVADRRFAHALKLLLEGQEIMNAKVGALNDAHR